MSTTHRDTRGSRAHVPGALAALLLSLTAVNVAKASCSFDAMFSYATIDPSMAFVVGDWNCDGLPDVAVMTNQSQLGNAWGGVTLLFGEPGGSFGSRADIPVGENPSAIVSADFDGDGVADLAVTHWDGVSVLIGYGDGTFAAPVLRFTYRYSGGLWTGDFNRDGISDLIVGANGGIVVLLGYGNGTFRALPPITSVGPVMAIGDLDGDGDLDLVTGGDYYHEVGRVYALLGNGDGTFAPPAAEYLNYSGGQVAIHDMNGDGVLDILGSSGWVMIGRGDGTFGNFQPLLQGAVHMNFADVNGDHLPDLVGVHETYDPGGRGTDLRVWLGQSDGSFGTEPIRGGGMFVNTATALVDVDRDGRPDLLALSQAGALNVLPGNGDGTFTSAHSDSGGQVIGIADMNGDGRVDAATLEARKDSRGLGHDYIQSMLQDGSGGFARGASLQLEDGPPDSLGGYLSTYGLVADIIGDAVPDAVVLSYSQESGVVAGKVTVFQGGIDGTFQMRMEFPFTPSPRDVAVGDLNGDGMRDLVVTQGNSTCSVLMGTGQGFRASVTFSVGFQPVRVAVADLNHDGRADLAITDGDSSVWLLKGRGDGTFSAGVKYSVGRYPGDIVAGDVNRDGLMDLVIAHQPVGSVAALVGDTTVTVLINTRNGTFTRHDYRTMPWPNRIAIGDVNGDGAPDLAVSCSSGLSFLYGSGDGRFTPAESGFGYPEGAFVAIADADGDGVNDVVYAYGLLNFMVLHTTGCQADTFPLIPPPGLASPRRPGEHRLPVGHAPRAQGAPGEGRGAAGVAIGELPTRLTVVAIQGVRGEMTIRLGLPRAARIDAELYDLAGRRVGAPLRGRAYAAGMHDVPLDAGGDGATLPRGIYFVRVRAGGEVAVARVVALE